MLSINLYRIWEICFLLTKNIWLVAPLVLWTSQASKSTSRLTASRPLNNWLRLIQIKTVTHCIHIQNKIIFPNREIHSKWTSFMSITSTQGTLEIFLINFFVKCKNLESIEFSNFNLKRHSQEALDRQDGNKNYITHVGNGYQRAPAYQNHWNQQHQNVYQNDRVVPTYDQFFGPPPHTVSTCPVFTKLIFKIQNSSNVY